MSTIRGNDGSVTIDAATVSKVTEFEVSAERQLLEDTGMGDAGRTYKAGFLNWTCRLRCRFDPNDATGQEALINAITGTSTSVALVLINEAGDQWSGTAVPVRLNNRQVIDGITEIDFDLQGSGALTTSFT